MTAHEDRKKPPRLAGRKLRLAASLLEAPGAGAVLFRVVSQQLGIAELLAVDIPPHVPPYRPLHLGGPTEAAGASRAVALAEDAEGGEP